MMRCYFRYSQHITQHISILDNALSTLSRHQLRIIVNLILIILEYGVIMRSDGIVCLSVCLVWALTFEGCDLESSILICRYIF